MSRTGIVVPCYNEAGRLEPDRFVHFCGQHPDVGFFFVNDGSRDETASVLEALRRRRPASIHLRHLAANQGKAEAVRQGMLQVMDHGAEAAGYWDADLSTPLDAIPRFREVLDRHREVTIVLGTRLPLLGRAIERAWLRHKLGRLFAFCASWVVGVPICDTQCGAKLLRVSDATRRLFLRPFLSRWIFDVELLARWLVACRAVGDQDRHRHLYELPLEQWQEVKGSKLRATDFVRAVKELWTIWRRYFSTSSVSPSISPEPVASLELAPSAQAPTAATAASSAGKAA